MSSAGESGQRAQVVLGIDPGAEGALACLRLDGSMLHSGMLPRTEKPARGPARNDLEGTVQILRAIGERCEVVCCGVELVTNQPGDGASSSARLVRHAGQLEGMALALGWPVELIQPSAWTRSLPLPKGRENRGARKQRLAEMAFERWPSMDLHLVKLYGQADAAWIADYTRARWLRRRG